MKNKREKDVYEVFDIISEQDFNPDFVRDGLFTMFDDGLTFGLLGGIGIGLFLVDGFKFVKSTYKKIKNKRAMKEVE